MMHTLILIAVCGWTLWLFASAAFATTVGFVVLAQGGDVSGRGAALVRTSVTAVLLSGAIALLATFCAVVIGVLG